MTNSATGALETPLDAASIAGTETRIEPGARSLPAWGAVFSLTMGVFGLVTTEFLPVSLLTPLAQDLGVSEGAAGQAITATAIVAGIAAPTLAIATRRIDRRHVILGLTLLLILSNLIAAFADSLPMLLVARVLLGIGLGGFWSMVGALTMRLVPSEMLSRAMSIVMAGVSAATVTAAPIGAYVGSIWGWREAFLLAGGVGIVALLIQLFTLPRLPPVTVASFGALVDVSRNPAIRMGLLAILLIVSGHFAGFTYVRSFLEQVPVFGVEAISLVLLAFGIGGFIGNLAGGFIAERNLKTAMYLPPFLMAVAAIALLVGGTSSTVTAIAITLWGFAFGSMPVAVQTWMVRAAPKEAESAGGLMVTAFQVAIASGAILGGLLVDNVGVSSVFIFFGLIALLATGVIGGFARAPKA
ncbi:MFS transporter [Manganibacter manganicus]|uniref:Transporter n=1 Tax=Manganibacter manganicus TaxID=1873176 RepID=A0A1V8RSC6_9HYPH|nr:MFS transporter [Pseudaminobacter manganicus]OQM76122.1 transporter [Pseudaminobacter manganicus]